MFVVTKKNNQKEKLYLQIKGDSKKKALSDITFGSINQIKSWVDYFEDSGTPYKILNEKGVTIHSGEAESIFGFGE